MSSFFVLIFKGILTGLVIAVPVGPIGVLCLQRTLYKGRDHGLASGFGAAMADALCGFAAGFGMYFLQNILTRHSVWFQFFGGVVLCGLAIKTWMAKPMHRSAQMNSISLLGSFTSVFFLALTNPFTIISIAAMFAGLDVTQTNGHLVSTSMLVLGVFTGSLLWWVVLSLGLGMFRKKFNHHRMRWINRLSSLILVGCGLTMLVNGLLSLYK